MGNNKNIDVEMEVKVLNIDIDSMIEKAESMGAKLIAKEKQTNIIFDSEDFPTEEHLGGYLRVRETIDIINNKKTVETTLKSNVKNSKLRKNIEYNYKKDTVEEAIEDLEKKGYKEVSRGYKDRTSYTFLEARLDFDVWDKKTYPNPYMEIEVKDEKVLDEVIDALGINRDNITNKSIKQLRKDLDKTQ